MNFLLPVLIIFQVFNYTGNDVVKDTSSVRKQLSQTFRRHTFLEYATEPNQPEDFFWLSIYRANLDLLNQDEVNLFITPQLDLWYAGVATMGSFGVSEGFAESNIKKETVSVRSCGRKKETASKPLCYTYLL